MGTMDSATLLRSPGTRTDMTPEPSTMRISAPVFFLLCECDRPKNYLLTSNIFAFVDVPMYRVILRVEVQGPPQSIICRSPCSPTNCRGRNRHEKVPGLDHRCQQIGELRRDTCPLSFPGETHHSDYHTRHPQDLARDFSSLSFAPGWRQFWARQKYQRHDKTSKHCYEAGVSSAK